MNRAYAALALLLVAAPAASAQEPVAQRQAEIIASWQRDGVEPPRVQRYRKRPDVVRFGVPYTLPADTEVGDVFVFGGDATIEGQVRGDLVVMFGRVDLRSTASVSRNFVVIGGDAHVERGAHADDDIAIIGTTLDAPPEFSSGGMFIVDPSGLGRWADALLTWIRRGLLWGRPIVPGLAWVWAVVGIAFLLYLLLNAAFDRSIAAAVATLRERPLTATLVGVLVMLLAGPVCVLLAVTGVGLVVVPFVIVALVAAGALGKVAAMRWLGSSVVHEQEGSRASTARSFVIGFVLLALIYMVPAVGIATWATTGVFGLGAVALTFISAYRRENPAPVPIVTAPAPRVVMPMPAAPPAVVPHATSQEVSPMPFTQGTSESFASPVVAATGTVPASDLALFPRAPFRDRLASGVLDFILILFLTQLVFERAPERLWMALALAYFIGFWVWKGATIGGIICQLRVVRVDGAPLRFVDGLIRGLSAIFSLIVLALGFLWILKDSERQAWHDRVAGTYVVKVPKNYPL